MVLAALALAIPLPALALEGEVEPGVGETQAPAALSVSTVLGGCGVTGPQVYCTLRVTFGTVDGATQYTAAVTRADGSVVDYGAIPAGGGALYVPYVGRGSYSVRISAYGPPPEDEDAGNDEPGRGELIVSDATETSADEAGAGPTGNAEPNDEAGQSGDGTRTANATETEAPGAGAEPSEETTEPPPCEPTPPSPPPEPPPLPEPPPPDTDPENPDEDVDGIADADEQYAYEVAVREQRAAQAAAQSQLPETIECPPAP